MSSVRFQVSFPNADKVYLAGDFNDWDPNARRMKRIRKGSDTFVAVLSLEPGRYEFRYVVDGEWMCCPRSPRLPNDMGTENSVIEVGG